MPNVVVVYRVCQKWRSPVFARLNSFDDMTVTVVHGEDIKGSKLINDPRPVGFSTVKLRTFCASISVSGRSAVVILYPTLFFNLLKLRPDVLLIEGGSNVVNNIAVYLYSFLKRVPVIWWALGELPDRKHSGFIRLLFSSWSEGLTYCLAIVHWQLTIFIVAVTNPKSALKLLIA